MAANSFRAARAQAWPEARSRLSSQWLYRDTAKADGEEHGSGDEIGDGVAAGPFLLVAGRFLHRAEKVGHADHRDQRRAEQHADAEVDQRRDDGAQRLRQQHKLDRPPTAEAERVGGLGLAWRQRLQAGADDLGEIGGDEQDQRRLDADEQVDVERRRHHRHDEAADVERDQHRHAANELDHSDAGDAQAAHLRPPGQRQRHGEDEGAGESDHPHQQGQRQTAPVVGRDRPQPEPAAEQDADGGRRRDPRDEQRPAPEARRHAEADHSDHQRQTQRRPPQDLLRVDAEGHQPPVRPDERPAGAGVRLASLGPACPRRVEDRPAQEPPDAEREQRRDDERDDRVAGRREKPRRAPPPGARPLWGEGLFGEGKGHRVA
jgi:hypothetical protein